MRDDVFWPLPIAFRRFFGLEQKSLAGVPGESLSLNRFSYSAKQDCSASPAFFSFKHVCLERNGTRLIDDLNLDIQPGRKYALMGPNGAGKSLTLRLLQGLIEPTAGRLQLPSTTADARTGGRAIVLQRPVLLRRSVSANLDHALKTYGMTRHARPEWISHWLEIAGLTSKKDVSARRLSGGEQQRLAFVRAMASAPSLLLLDEPTAHLDPQSTKHIERLIDWAHDQGTTILLVTHDAGQAHRVADHVLFMQAGQLIEQAPARQFFNAPQSSEAQHYLEGRLLSR